MRNMATLQDKITTSFRSVSAQGWSTSGSLTNFGDVISRVHPGEPHALNTNRRFHTNTSNTFTGRRNTRVTSNHPIWGKINIQVSKKDNRRSYRPTKEECVEASRQHKASFGDQYGERRLETTFKRYCSEKERNSDNAQEDLEELEIFHTTISNNLRPYD